MDVQQRERLIVALVDWPQKTGISWSACAIGFLCKKAGISFPSNAYITMSQVAPQLERHYGLPCALQVILANISIKVWRTKRARSKLQEQALRMFLQTQI